MDEVRARDYLHYPLTPFKQLDETAFLKSTFLVNFHSFFMALPWSLFTFRSNLYIHSFCSTLSIRPGVSWACWFFPGFFMESSIFKSHLLLYPVFCRGGNYRIETVLQRSAVASCEKKVQGVQLSNHILLHQVFSTAISAKKGRLFYAFKNVSCTASSAKKHSVDIKR